jgi:molybdate transport system regulatory protein
VKRKPKSLLLPRLRIVFGRNIAFGPGKAELLALVAETGSIAEAAKRMSMSYMRAWSLTQTMNASFKQPFIETVRGGQERGGAERILDVRQMPEAL